MGRAGLQPARDAPTSTKARILTTAEEVFAAKGFAGASTREIAARAGVNISSLHYHWDSKETLYFAVFRNVYDRISEVVHAPATSPPLGAMPVEAAVETSIGQLFDFFDDHPTIPKLLLRRLVEDDVKQMEMEHDVDVLVPVWKAFAGGTRHIHTRPLKEPESMLFMLTVHSILLLFTLDSREFSRLLGRSMRIAEVRKRVRTHIIRVAQRLLESD